MAEQTWDGTTRATSPAVRVRHRPADCAKRCDWLDVFAILDAEHFETAPFVVARIRVLSGGVPQRSVKPAHQ